MEPFMDDKKLYYKYLNKCEVYFEYGSGGSTYQASIRKNIVKLYSVESDKNWYDKVSKNINNQNFTYIYNEMHAKPNNLGKPGPKATNEQKMNYSNHLIKLPQEEIDKIDLILIDGRFRVACCLKSLNYISDDCLIVFDDFLNRKFYHVVLDYCDIIDKGKRMVVLKKKKNMNEIPTELIEKYELIMN